MNPRRTAAVLAAVTALVVAGCSPSIPTASDRSPAGGNQVATTTQTSDGGQVTVEVEWAGPSAGAEFQVSMDTHAIDLDPFDLADSTLRNDRGETLTVRPWAAPKGGHHRQGRLSFDGDAQAFLAGAEWIELVVTGVGDLPERTLRWELGA